MLEADVHEPMEFLPLINTSVPASREILNERHWADYRWQNSGKKWTQVERKTWSEVLADLNAVEDQLRRHMANQPEARLLFVLEGLVDVGSEGTYVLKQTGKESVWVRSWRSGTRISRVYSWLYSVSEYIEVFQTGSYPLTCQFLVQAYNQDQKPAEDKHTFNRHFKKPVFHPNPQVMQLMGLAPGLGEKRSEALIGKFSTVWNVLSANPRELESVPGIGARLASTILQRIGRPDV